MKKIFIFIGIIMLMMAVFTTAEVIMVDDFNNPNGDLTGSSQNDLGYYYNTAGNNCEYLNNEIHCNAESNYNVMNVTEGSTLEFDYKCNSGECRIDIGTIYPSYSFILRINGVTGATTLLTASDWQTIATLDINSYHHVEMLYNISNSTINLTIDGVNYGEHIASSGGNPMTFDQFYKINHAAGGESFYVDNITLDDNAPPPTVYNTCENDTMESGHYIMNSDLNCNTTWALYIEAFNDITLDCQGHTITCGSAECIKFADCNNVVVKNCNIYDEDISSSYALANDNGDNFTIVNNKLTCVNTGTSSWNGCYQMSLGGTHAYVNFNFSNNTIISDGYAFNFNYGGSVTPFNPLYFYENNLTGVGGIFSNTYNSATNISRDYSIGNLYNIASYTCIDANYDGYCENAFSENSTGFYVYDDYPLSEYYWTPYVPPVQPFACGDDLSSGIYTLIDDLDCTGQQPFTITANNDVTVDCAGYAITGTDIEIGEVSNIEVKNCEFQLYPAGSSEAIVYYPYNATFHNNDVYVYNGRALMDIEGWDDVVDYGFELYFYDNNFVYDSDNPTTDIVFQIFFETFTPEVHMYRNNITTDTDYVYYYREWEFWGVNDTTVVSYNSLGNDYTVSGWTCTDADYDGFCDSVFSELNPIENGTVLDNYPLSEYYWTPYVCSEDWACSTYSCDGSTGIKTCSAVTDNNVCGTNYTGNYSEYTTTCPVYDSGDFGSGSTDLSQIDDYTNVSSLTVTSPGDTSSIQWLNNVDIDGSNLSATLTLGTGFVSVDSGTLDASLDTPADVTISTSGTDASCGSFWLYYASGYQTTQAGVLASGQLVATQSNIGGDCTDSSVCQNVQCSGGVIIFEAQHFDAYGIQSNQAAREGCLSTKLIIFAGFALLAVAIIALAAFAIIQMVSGSFNVAMFSGLAIAMVGLAVVLMVGFVIINAVGAAVC